MKKILILTASFGEGHNSAARGLRDALTQIAPDSAEVEVHDLFAETYGPLNEWTRRAYLGLINRAPRAWAALYHVIDRRKDFSRGFQLLFPVRNKLRALLTRFQPDAVVSVYPVYPHMLAEMADLRCKSFVVVTDSITVNAIWFRCRANCFLVPNEQTAAMLRAVGIAESAIKVTGFPVTPKFADLGELRQPPSDSSSRRVLYMINAGKNIAPEIVGRLAALPGITLTVTVGRDEKLRAAIEAVREKSATRFEIVGWTDQMPRLLLESHLLIGKAGGATVQETIAACCPMIINQVVPGQEEGNARLMVETGSGVVATTPEAITDTVRNAFANDASQWREWHKNISALSRPSASLEIAQFLLAL